MQPSEIALRTALGASSRRIVGQLVVEALVLGSLAATLGLVGAQAGLTWFVGVFPQIGQSGGEVEMGLMGFWFDGRLSIWTVMFTMLFTILVAISAGVEPALRMTGRGVQPRLQRAGTGGASLAGGRIWSGVIVTQIALTVAFVPFAIVAGVGEAQIKEAPFGFPTEEYLSMQFATDREFLSISDIDRKKSRDPGARYLASLTELKRRLGEEPTVAAVTVASQVPGAVHRRRWIDVEGATAPPRTARGHRVDVAAVDLDFFDALGTSVISGRGFDAADLGSGEYVVVVNEEFVRVVLGDRSPIGRRISFEGRRARAVPSTENPRPWYEIVGVVRQIAMTPPDPKQRPDAAGIYQLLGPTEAYPLHMTIHVGREPASFAGRLQELATEVDPTLQVHHVRPLDESSWEAQLIYRIGFWLLAAGGVIAILLSTAGIFSLMSFAVSRRTREIGVRVALGADRGRIVTTVSSRVLNQIGLGVGSGGVLLSALILLLPLRSDFEYQPEAVHAVFVAAYLIVMLCVCMLACVVPMRRALGVEPTEALRAEG